MAGLVPAIHASSLSWIVRTWMPGTSPGMTKTKAALHRRADESIPLAPDLPDRRRRKMRGAAQRVGVAIALQEAAACGCRRCLVDVELDRELRIQRLDR